MNKVDTSPKNVTRIIDDVTTHCSQPSEYGLLLPGPLVEIVELVEALVAEVAAREQAARREAMEEAAQHVDCGCDIRDAVLARLESQGEKKASYLCPHGDVCCALQAAYLRGAVKEISDE